MPGTVLGVFYVSYIIWGGGIDVRHSKHHGMGELGGGEGRALKGLVRVLLRS